MVFGAVGMAALAVDQLAFHRRNERIPFGRALLESAGWIGVSFVFAGWVYYSIGTRAGAEFLTAYLIEKSLSLDNIFVFLVIFRTFHVPEEFQSKVLYGGILGALLLRAAFVIAGIKLLAIFHGLAYVFAIFLLLLGARMLVSRARISHPAQNWIVRFAQRFFPVTEQCNSGKFFIRRAGRWTATSLFLALIAIETMDVVFAADSIPAVLAVTRSTFIAYSSNVFAILGLRALYFALADIFPRFRFLHQAVAAILIFVGLKMLLAEKFAISTAVSLVVVCGILALAIVGSVVSSRRTTKQLS